LSTVIAIEWRTRRVARTRALPGLMPALGCGNSCCGGGDDLVARS
jgi:hypothetical protein